MARHYRYMDFQINAWKQDYPELWAQFDACRTRKALNKLVRDQKKDDNGHWGILDAFRDDIRDTVDAREVDDAREAHRVAQEEVRQALIANASPTIDRAELVASLKARLGNIAEKDRARTMRLDDFERAWNLGQYHLYSTLISLIEEGRPLV